MINIRVLKVLCNQELEEISQQIPTVLKQIMGFTVEVDVFCIFRI